MPDIVLHQWCISPYCGKIRKILAFKRLSYRIEEYGGLRGLKAKSLSRAGMLPVLDYDGERVQDSSAIARFLEERHPTPSLWPDGVDRGLAHLLEDWADESLYNFELWFRLRDPQALTRAVSLACAGRPSYEHVLYKVGFLRSGRPFLARGLDRYPREMVLASFQEHVDALAARLARSPWLAGQAPSIADLAVAAQLDEMVRTSSKASELVAGSALPEWLSRCSFAKSADSPASAPASARTRHAP